MRVMSSKLIRVLGVALALSALAPVSTWAQPVALQRCWLQGVEHEALCGTVERPLDPMAPDAAKIAVHFSVLPALARNKKPDPVFFFAGGPGQSAIGLAGALSGQLARLLNRRDVVLVDQRGTGRSAPLQCAAETPTRPLREMVDPAVQFAELERCRGELQRLPHGDLRQYTTSIAMADADAVRRALGVERVNLVGGSYGTRAALEFLRQFPQSVRRVVIDGVAPSDMALPLSFSTDNQAAFDALLASCAADAACSARHPRLRAQWQALLDGLPRSVRVAHPVTGREETVVVTRDMVIGLVRLPLYVPALAAALPHAVAEASQGRFGALLGLAVALGGGRNSESRMAAGMHFSVVCAEDMPRLALAQDKPGTDFGASFAQQYERICANWPRARVPAAFYDMPPSASPVLVLSGGIDPVTPARHGERAAKALGPKARHVVVPNAGHGVMALACMRDVLFRFIDAEGDDEALAVDADCAQGIPRPPAFVPPGAGVVAGEAGR
jgi:pimeloyl-ACP methyl ester carboxylesterase